MAIGFTGESVAPSDFDGVVINMKVKRRFNVWIWPTLFPVRLKAYMLKSIVSTLILMARMGCMGSAFSELDQPT